MSLSFIAVIFRICSSYPECPLSSSLSEQTSIRHQLGVDFKLCETKNLIQNVSILHLFGANLRVTNELVRNDRILHQFGVDYSVFVIIFSSVHSLFNAFLLLLFLFSIFVAVSCRAKIRCFRLIISTRNFIFFSGSAYRTFLFVFVCFVYSFLSQNSPTLA